MIPVSTAYQSAQQSSSINPVRKIELFRRLADGSDWEPNPIDITNEVVRLERLSWKLDTNNLNEFKASNIRIEVDNSSRIWDDNSPGRFSGFLRYNTKIKISLGLLIEGAEETFPVFTGVIEDVLEDSSTPTLQLDIESFDAILRNHAASEGGIEIVNELLGIGDGVQSDFFTQNLPVGEIKEIRLDGELLRPGLRFSVSNLNDVVNPAKVTFLSSQPAPGQEVRADYVVWKKDQAIDQVVTDLMALVPQVTLDLIEQVIFSPPAEREILHTTKGDFDLYSHHQSEVQDDTPPPPDDGLISLNAFNTKSKWEGGTLSNMNLTRIQDGLTPKWVSQYEGLFLPEDEKAQIDGDSNFPWQESFNAGVGTTRGVSNGILSVNQPGSFYFLSNFNEGAGISRSFHVRMRVTQLSGTIEIGGMVDTSFALGAQIRIRHLNKLDIQSGSGSSPFVNVDLTQFHNYRLDFNMASSSSGTWQLFIDGVSQLTGTVGTAPAGAQTGIYFRSTVSGQTNFEIDYLRFNGNGAGFPVGTWEKIIDYGIHLAGLTTFSLINTLGSFFADIQGNQANARYFFSWSQDNLTYSPEQEFTIGNNLGSFTNVDSPRYIKFRLQLTGDGNATLFGVKKLFLPGLSISPVIDGGDGLVSWDTWKGTFVPNDGNIQRFTAAVANSGSGFSYYQAIGANDSIQTDEFAQSQNAIAKQLILISLITTAGLSAPLIRENLVDFQTQTVLVSMANFGTQSVLDVIKELARIADYEIGLKGDGSFFFRNKTTGGASVLTLDDSNVIKVNSASPGWDRVFNLIQASFGNFVKEISSETENEPSPTSIDRFGDRSLPVGGGNLLFQTDVDLATVMARRYYSRYKEPKRRATLVIRFMPELELGDKVTLAINNPRPIADNFDARVVGIAHNLMGFTTELDLEEIV